MDCNKHSGQREEHRVKDAIHGRALFTLEVLGVTVLGTCHLPYEQTFAAQAKPGNTNGAGILFLSGFMAPRAGIGDSTVYWADSFAKCGYMCFRVDLPGSCDSGGDAPTELMNFINSGSYEAMAVEVMKQITARYKLSKVIVLGHCSGAVTALFAAPACKDCRGLILLEPYFHLPPQAPTKTRGALSHWAASNRLGGALSNLFDLLKDMHLRLRRNKLPNNANFSLIQRWKTLASAGLPILVLKAPGPKAASTKPRLGEFDYLAHVVRLGGGRGRVDVKVIEGAAHSFADDAGRLAVRQHAETWLNENFSQAAEETPFLREQSQILSPAVSISR
jgi:alpha-beta hydrolase superfamily lysophospholipase